MLQQTGERKKGISALRLEGYSLPKVFLYHLWCWMARGPMLAMVKKAKVKPARSHVRTA